MDTREDHLHNLISNLLLDFSNNTPVGDVQLGYAQCLRMLHSVSTARRPQLGRRDKCEQALLGSIILNNDVFDIANKSLSLDSFGDKLNGYIFQTIEKMLKESKPVTGSSICAFIQGGWPVAELMIFNTASGDLSFKQYIARLVAMAEPVERAHVLVAALLITADA